MKLTVDGLRCTGHGRCYTVAPDVYTADDDGRNAAAGSCIEVPPELEARAIAGARSCPEHAITPKKHT